MSNDRNWPAIAAHSMTIGGYHTFDDWSMVPAEIPVFAPPEPKYHYVDVPVSDGSLDYTEKLTGSVYYKNRTGSFSFIVLDDEEWPVAYSEVMKRLHGKLLRCVLDDDPEYYYTGRFSVNEWKSNRGYNRIVIDYNVEPYKQGFVATGDDDWLWDDPFDSVIYYGTFEVTGSKSRNLINPSGVSVKPKFILNADMTVTFGGTVYELCTGITTDPGFMLAPGDNIMTFTGTGAVLVDYTKDKRL